MVLKAGPVLCLRASVRRLVWEISGVFHTLFQTGPIKAFGMCTKLRTGKKRAGELIGMIPVLGSMALAIGYTVVVGWIFKYAFLALSGNLYTLGQDMGAIGGLFDGTASGFGNKNQIPLN